MGKHEEMLKEAVKKHEIEKAAEEEKRLREELEEKRKVKSFEKREKELYPKKLLIAEKIMKWVKGFNKEFDFKDVIIFYGSWGHKRMQYGSYGCWSRMYFQRPNKLEYWPGYKWMPSGLRITFDNKEKLAEKLSYDYLSSLYQAITTGKVHKTVERELES